MSVIASPSPGQGQTAVTPDAEQAKIIGLLRRGAGVTQILGEITHSQEPPREQLRHAQRLQLVLETVGSLHLTPRKLLRTLTHLEQRISEMEAEVEWAEPRRPCPLNAG